MGAIKNDVKKAMRAIVEWGAMFIRDDDLNWCVNGEVNTLRGFTQEDLTEAVERLEKKLPKGGSD